MSIKLMSRAWDMEIPIGQKMVLLALTDRANDEGECWPGQEELARKSSLSPRSVVSHIEWLEDHGLVRVERRQRGRMRLSNRYIVTLDAYCPEGGLMTGESENSACANLACANSDTKKVQLLQGVSATVAPSFNEEPSMNHQYEPSLFQAPLGGAPVAAGAGAKVRKAAGNPLAAETWAAYAEAYRQRYGVDPVRNATVNGQIGNFVKRLGENAPHVAAYFVGSASAFYVSKGHAVGVMLCDAEKLHTEWATGRRVTQSAARQADRTASNFANAQEALAMLDAEMGGRQ
ncbi:ArsR family DNA-binding transcriptional regulator [Chromobacterium vaccinii]|nr:ArsR family DNA-binding transcriptional regulator [Chromobacterium vaccinii]QND88989.1 ArsR family DNA-binding transcriptional regulator [Chromobacterium vaccinii]